MRVFPVGVNLLFAEKKGKEVTFGGGGTYVTSRTIPGLSDWTMWDACSLPSRLDSNYCWILLRRKNSQLERDETYMILCICLPSCLARDTARERRRQVRSKRPAARNEVASFFLSMVFFFLFSWSLNFCYPFRFVVWKEAIFWYIHRSFDRWVVSQRFQLVPIFRIENHQR